MSREALAARRNSLNFTIEHHGERYHVTQGEYSDGRIGEIFINRIYSKTSAKVGTLLDDVCRDLAILISFALQYGADLTAISHAVARDGEGLASTVIGEIIDRIIVDQIKESTGPRATTGGE